MTQLPSSLRFRFLVGSLVFLVILFGLVSFNTNRILDRLALEHTQAIIDQTSETLNIALVPYTNVEELSTLNDYLDGLITGNDLGILYLAILDEQGNTLVSTHSTPQPLPATAPDLAQQLSESNMVHAHQNILLANNSIGQLKFGLSTQLLKETSKRLIQENLLLIAAGLLVSIILLSITGGRVGQQLKQLVEASQALASGNHENRAPESGKNELAYLAHNFNVMADSVAERSAALKESESKLRATINNPSLLIGLLNTEGHILLANRALHHLHTAQSDLSGMPFHAIEAFQHDKIQIAQLKRSIELGLQGQASQFSLNYRTEASTRFAEFSIQPVKDDQGQIMGLVAQAIDVTERKKIEDALGRVNAEWRQAMDQFADPIYLVDLEHKLVRANRPFYEMIQSSSENCVGRPITDLLHPHDDSKHCPVCEARNHLQESVVTLEANEPHNPSGRPIEARLKLVRDQSGQVTGILTSMYDLSHARQIEERTRLSSSVFDNTAECIFITDIQGHVVEVNRAFTEMMGYSRDAVIGANPSLWKSGRHDESFYRNMWQALTQEGHWRGEIWNRRKDGSVFPAWGTISRVDDDKGTPTHYVSVFTDVSQIKQSEEQLNHLAHHDALTGLPNRLLLMERLEQAIRHAQRHQSQLAVVFLDLDNFKTINDSLGHAAGDIILQKAATRLAEAVRNDDTVARIGGDEFVLLLEDIKTEHVGVVAEKITHAFRSSFMLEQREITATCSMGIALFGKDGDTPAVLMRNADSALYRAKEEGRNTYQFYTEEMTRNAFERVLLENSLRQAIDRDEFILLFQPQIDINTQQMIGAEALIRWQHPEFGMVSPIRFIPLSEETGLIHPIGKWVLLATCIQGRTWLDQGIEFGRLSVNIAGPQIKRGDLVDDVMTVLAETQLPAHRLELEVTEGFIMEDPQFAIQQMIELRKLGVYLSIDDFGTGYSSLSYLKQLPVHKLKIDQSFMRGIPEDSDDRAICNAIIAMSQNLELSVIAEGVETEEQAEFLVESGCTEAQGYLYSKPIPAEDMPEFINSRTNQPEKHKTSDRMANS